MINKNRLIKLTQDLIKIDSQNPPGDEECIARFVENYLKRLGLRTKIYEFKKKRASVIAVLEGKDKSRSLLLTPHLDTVPAGRAWHFNPFEGKIVKGRIYGLGATDCKGNLACGIEAINSIVERKFELNYNLIFAATADEESGSDLGLALLLDKGVLKPDEVVVLDADDFSIIVAQKGLLHLTVKIKGKRAHGAYPWLGINAIDISVNILKELKEYKFSYKKNKYLHPPTVNIGKIHGGDKVNVVADYCEFELDFRFSPGTEAKSVINSLKKIISKYAKDFKIEIQGIQKPYLINESHYLVEGLSEAIKKVNKAPLIKGSEGATVISFFQKLNIPALATGFGTETCAHATDEYAIVENLYKGAQALEYFLQGYRRKNNGRD